MTEFFANAQINILITNGIVALFLVLFTAVIRFHSIKKKKALIKIELSVGILAIADAQTYIFRGNMADFAFCTLKVADFLTFALIPACIYFLDEYITALFMETGKFEKLPKRLLASYILSSIAVTLLVISQFTGIFYYYDENGLYTRGPLYLISFIFPLICFLLLFSFVLQYRNMINKRLFWSILVFSSLPIIGAAMQSIKYGISWMNFAIFLSCITLFCCALTDQNIEFEKAANTELATGLPNTYGYIYEVDKVVNFKDITAYNGFYFDIVRMGRYNNEYGKAVGDDIILKYAATIRRSLDKDEILGRLGGNFFVALVKKTNTDRFLELLSGVPLDVDFLGRTVHLRVEAVAGCYEVKSRNIAAGQILGYTSAAVAYAKNQVHKPYVFWDDQLEATSKKIRKLEENARIGLEGDEFEPFYQPKVNSEDGTLCGAEALVRWRREGKLISPAEFIPIMEKNNSICALDIYNLKKVCQDIRGWIDSGISPVTVSVNFSRKNLANSNLADEIKSIIDQYNIPTDLIQVEITETVDEYPIEVLVDFVEKLHAYGISVAIDDFGTGSSSIELLKQVRFDVLKIDRGFVDYKNDTEKLILRDIISLAKDIDIDLVAEGVEQEQQIAELKEMGCTVIQGFIYDRPLPKEDYELRLKNKQYQ